MPSVLTSLMLALALALQATAPHVSLERFRTTARFSVDARDLALTSAVATIEPHPRVHDDEWVHVYFYAFPFTAEDVAGVAGGRVDHLDQKQLQTSTPATRNASRAVVHLLLERGTASNVSLELPGVTCTIAESPEKVKLAFPEFLFDGGDVVLRGSGVFQCDLASVGMGKPVLRWDVNVRVPSFAKR